MLSLSRDLHDPTNGDLWNRVAFEYHPQKGLLEKVVEREIEATNFGPIQLGASSTAVHTYETLVGYDLLDRVVAVDRQPEGGGTGSVLHQYCYDSLGSLVRFEDSIGAKLEWLFDGLGGLRRRTEKGVNGGEITTHTAIDFINDVVTRTDAEQRVSRFVYDKAGRIVRQELPGYVSGSPAFSRVFGYDAAGRVGSVINGNGVRTTRTYDAAGRLKSQVVEDNPIHSLWATKETYTYGPFGEVEWAKTFAGPSTGYVSVVEDLTSEDAYGRPSGTTFIFSGYGFSAGPDYAAHPSGSPMDFLARRGTRASYTPDIHLELDGLMRAWECTDPTTKIAQYRYAGGRVRERQQGGTTSGGWVLGSTYGWDPLRRLESVQTGVLGGSQLSRFDHEYDLEGHLKKRKRTRIGGPGQNAGAGDWFKLDEYYRLAAAKLGVEPTQFDNPYVTGADFDGVTVFQRHLDYSPAGSELDKAQNRHLLRETVGGNASETSYAVDPSSHRYDEITQPNGVVVKLEYDGEGNLTFDGAYRYVYDFKNRLSEVYLYIPAQDEQPLAGSSSYRGTSTDRPRYRVPAERLQRIYMRGRDRLAAAARGTNGLRNLDQRSALADQSSTSAATEGNLLLIAVYMYDAYNRRVMRALLGQPILYSAWDGWREVAEYQFVGGGESWRPVRAYVWGSRIDELVRFSKYDAQTSIWTHYHPQQDHQDSVDMLVDANGVPKEKYEYDPFGGVKVFTWNAGAWDTTPAPYSLVGNPYLFTGRRFDPETGLGYYRNRYYSTSLGRFLTGDQLGLHFSPGGQGNPYQYGENSPLSVDDPLGLYTIVFVVHHPTQGGIRRNIDTQAARKLVNADPYGGKVVHLDVNEKGEVTSSTEDIAGKQKGASDLTIGLVAHGENATPNLAGGDKTLDAIENGIDDALADKKNVHPTKRGKKVGPKKGISTVCHSATDDALDKKKARSSNPVARLADKYGCNILGWDGYSAYNRDGLLKGAPARVVSPDGSDQAKPSPLKEDTSWSGAGELVPTDPKPVAVRGGGK